MHHERALAIDPNNAVTHRLETNYHLGATKASQAFYPIILAASA